MNHTPYKDWLLSDDLLSAEQTKALQEHLRTCEVCQQLEPAWSDVHTLIQKTPLVQPIPGFTDRWQFRLIAHKMQKQRHLAWMLWGVCAGIALILLGIFSTQILEILDSPGSLILVWVSRLTGVLSLYWAAQNMLGAIVEYIPAITWFGMVLGIGMVSFLSVSWLAMVRRLTIARRLA